MSTALDRYEHDRRGRMCVLPLKLPHEASLPLTVNIPFARQLKKKKRKTRENDDK